MAILALGGSNAEGRMPLLGALKTSNTEEVRAAPLQATNLHMADLNSVFTGSGGDTASAAPSAAAGSLIMSSAGLAAITPPDSSFLDGFKANQIVTYTVQQGDTIGGIAADFGVSADTIVWANTIKDPNSLSLGQVLKILPVTGVLHTVRAGDTVASIATRYKGDPLTITSFNNLQNDENLVVGDEVIVPAGQMPGPKPSVKLVARGSGASGIYVPVGNGQCVDFVQAHGYSHLRGNAYLWAKYVNTTVPVAGGVVVLRGGRYGHVALVTAVKSGSVQIVEQNYFGPYIIDHREIALNDRSIVGFIR